MPELTLPNGYYELPKGKLANIVTCLEMRAKPLHQLQLLPEECKLVRINPDDLEAYRTLFRKVGEDWMWFSRLIMPDSQLHAILADPAVKSWALHAGESAIGLMELDFRRPGECELAFFGLTPSAIGRGLGRALVDTAIIQAWAQPISRLWVHTCSFDSPSALPFYMRSGFIPFSRMVEIHDDARLSGKLPMSAAPQVPLI